MIPIPNTEQTCLKSDRVNFSLYSPRMIDWENDKDGKLTASQESISQLFSKSGKCFPSAGKILENRNRYQNEYLCSLKELGIQTFEFHAKTTSPFITGLGSGHPTETGMILDRNSGYPYIPASSIKGVCLLSHAINLAKTGKVDDKGNVPDCLLEEYFGTQDEKAEKKLRGQLVFLDAYTLKIPNLIIDIMNPHNTDYYSGKGKKQPVETESPKPIKFLAVKKGTEFVFRCFYLPLDKEKAHDVSTDVNEMFKTAFEAVGFGGKTSIGYGRFKKL